MGTLYARIINGFNKFFKNIYILSVSTHIMKKNILPLKQKTHQIKSGHWKLISTHCIGFAKWTSSSSHWRCSVRVFTFRSIMARANTIGLNPFWTKGTIFQSKNWHNSLAFNTTNTDLVFVWSPATVVPDKIFQLFLNFFLQIKLILSGNKKNSTSDYDYCYK